MLWQKTGRSWFTSQQSRWRVLSHLRSGPAPSGKPTERSSRRRKGKKLQNFEWDINKGAHTFLRTSHHILAAVQLHVHWLSLLHPQGECSCLCHAHRSVPETEVVPQSAGAARGPDSPAGHHTHSYSSRATGPQSPPGLRGGEGWEQKVKLQLYVEDMLLNLRLIN